MVQQRQTAYKVSIGLLLSSKISFTEERFDHIDINNKKVMRVSLVANIIDKYVSDNKPYATFTLDDGTGQIRAKFFEDINLLEDINVGDTVLLVGWLRHFNDELYLQPEIVKKLDVRWIIARKLELERDYGKNVMQIHQPMQEMEQQFPRANEEEISVHEEKIEMNNEKEQPKKEHNLKDDILDLVTKNNEGIDIEKIILSLNYPVAEINSAITELIEEGKIYEPQPGRIRSI